MQTRLILAVLALAGCGGGESALPASDGPAAPVLLVGADGLDWSLALPLLRSGELPNLAALVEGGAVASLGTLAPTWSPRLWTTVATGKEPAVHGIEDFVRYDETRTPVSLYTQEDRRTKAHWNILSDAGVGVDTIGWWMTFPVEPVDGLMVAQTNSPVADDGTRSGPEKGVLREGVPHQVWPPEREAEVFARFREVDAGLDATLARTYGEVQPYSDEAAERWEACRWAFRADNTYLELALARAARPEGPAPVTAVYLGGTDVVGHRFFAAHRPGPFGLAPDHPEVTTFGDVIPDTYRFLDAALGRLVAAWPPDSTVVLVSDHGMVSLHREALHRGLFVERDGRMGISNTGGHPVEPGTGPRRGVLVVAGPGARPGAGRPSGTAIVDLRLADVAPVGGLLDVLPTLLALCGLPAGEDMPGRVLTELVDVVALPRIPTWDDPVWLASRVRTGIQPVDAAGRIEQLEDLGYLGDE